MASPFTKVVANFSTTLVANLSVGGVTATLGSNLTKEGVAIPTGKYCFTVNQGKSNEQHFICTVTGTAITAIQGVDRLGNISAGAQKDARINDEIKLTDFVNLKTLVAVLEGTTPLDGTNPMEYDATPTLSDPLQLPHKGYVDGAIATAILNILSGNNTFTGNNVFSGTLNLNGQVTAIIPIKAPDPVAGDDLATRAFVLAQAFGTTLIAGLNSPEINYRPDGLVRSVHDNDNGKTYVFVYDEATAQLKAIQDGTNEWAITYNSDGVVSSIYKH